jgi:DNA-binding MarR family transcriptional regulator
MDHVKWLSRAEQRAWIGMLASTSGLVFAADRQLQADSGITFDTYSILAALSEAPGMQMHMSELAGIAGHSQSRLSHAVSRLERSSLIRRSECSVDRRAVHATLTDDGLSLVQRAAPMHVTAIRARVFDRLTPAQIQSLADITRTLYAGLVEEGVVSPIPLLRD